MRAAKSFPLTQPHPRTQANRQGFHPNRRQTVGRRRALHLDPLGLAAEHDMAPRPRRWQSGINHPGIGEHVFRPARIPKPQSRAAFRAIAALALADHPVNLRPVDLDLILPHYDQRGEIRTRVDAVATRPADLAANRAEERNGFSWKQDSSENAVERTREAATSDSMQTHPA